MYDSIYEIVYIARLKITSVNQVDSENSQSFLLGFVAVVMHFNVQNDIVGLFIEIAVQRLMEISLSCEAEIFVAVSGHLHI